MLAKLRNIQILLVLAIFQLDVPRQATDFLSSMNKIVGFGSYFSFGLIDSESVVSDSLSEQAHNIGFRSHLVMINNGSVYVMILSLLLTSLVTRLASKTQIFSKKSRNQCNKVAGRINARGFSELLNFAYLILAVSFALNVKLVSFESPRLVINSILMSLNCLIVICYPLWLMWKLRQGFAK